MKEHQDRTDQRHDQRETLNKKKKIITWSSRKNKNTFQKSEKCS